ncbi:MAG: glycosyltransferase [Candidatus Omnitrophica bacterium]|nr:glycosyltransferase [Candidatus Omnitrophota bacterium]MBU4477812.1 glycosyltransferase [Candidatus Omnitrophota bacterium]MCG2703552.1 glycosyltransferase [Candidatus Omnitrophota bacterium]
MKILYVSFHNPHFFTITEYVERAIRGLGHELISFDDRQFVFPGRLREKLALLQKFDLKRINQQLITLVKKAKPDICLVSGGYRILPATVEKIKRLKIKTVLWTSDVPRHLPSLESFGCAYDFVFCGGTEAIEMLAKAGINNARWLPFGCDKELHKPVDVSKTEQAYYGADVVFIGSLGVREYSFRVKILEAISEYDLKVWGPGAEEIECSSALKKHIRGPGMTPQGWCKAYSLAKIGLCMHFRDPEGKVPCYQASPRVFEILACKCFLLVDKQPDVLSLFEDGKHLVVFEDADDLRRKIKYYLEHAQERITISEAGYALVHEQHTYTQRIRKLLEIIRGDDGE